MGGGVPFYYSNLSFPQVWLLFSKSFFQPSNHSAYLLFTSSVEESNERDGMSFGRFDLDFAVKILEFVLEREYARRYVDKKKHRALGARLATHIFENTLLVA